MIKGRALRKGDTVGLVSPAGSLKDLAQLDEAVATLQRLGFVAKTGESCRAKHGYLAGKDDVRAADMNRFFADPEVAGIVCLKGGYGSPRILDALDYGMIARNPKAFVGFSDITALHLALNKHAGLVTLHGPMGISGVLKDEPFSIESWMKALTSSQPLGQLANPVDAPPRKTLVGGKARGTIIGGNLAIIAATMGTPYEIETKGRILFLEDVNEEPYRVDRMLTQLRLAGKLEACAGIVLGDWSDCHPEEVDRSLQLSEVFEELLLPLGKPVLTGLQAGHCRPAMTMPFGVEALLDADAMTLEIYERALVP
jgi:muramoyltetrapeptide carboxypeptidase